VPYIAHCPFVLLNDLYTWKVSKLVIGKNGARLAMILVFFNRFQTLHMARTLSNSLEQTFTMVAFFYYLEQRDRFNKNTIILTALITISFMMRNTSPVGWVPLLAIKVFREGSLIPFLISGVFVALPLIFLCIWIDTTMYGANNWVVTSYNFLQMNIVMGLSKTFGEDPWHWYLTFMIPVNITILTPFAFVSVLYTHLK
jgi:hypothetical protein